MIPFDYSIPAGIFAAGAGRKRGGMTYRRFATAAEAIKFAVEETPEAARPQISMEVDEATFDHTAILKLYNDPGYPLRSGDVGSSDE